MTMMFTGGMGLPNTPGQIDPQTGAPVPGAAPQANPYNFDPSGSYERNLEAYRSANPSTDSPEWLKLLAPQQQQWMAAHPNMGPNPMGNNFNPRPDYANRPGVTSGQGSTMLSGDANIIAQLFSMSGAGKNTNAADPNSSYQQMAKALQGYDRNLTNNSMGYGGSNNTAILQSLNNGYSPEMIMRSMNAQATGPAGQVTLDDISNVQRVAQQYGMYQPKAQPQQGGAGQPAGGSNPYNPSGAGANPNGDIAFQNQMRQTYMDSPTYNPQGANTWAIQNGQIGDLQKAAANPYGNNQAANAQVPGSTGSPTPPAGTQVADGGANPFQSGTSQQTATTPSVAPTTPNPYSTPNPAQAGTSDGKWVMPGQGKNAGTGKGWGV